MLIKIPRILTFVAVIAGTNLAFSQEPFKDVQIASPNAAALGKFVDVPVNTHTGIPQISIPIYNFQEGSLSVPISLDYHAGGLKVQETSSWVGAGWALQAGGMITRSIRGGWPDEDAPNSELDLMHQGGYEYFAYKVYEGMLLDEEYDLICDRDDIMMLTSNSNEDYEPDIFFFNFLGYSGKFYVGKNYRVVAVPESPLDIKVLFADGLNKISGWEVTDQNGIKYYFGMTSDPTDVDPIELVDQFTKDGGSAVAGNTVSGWFLYKIASPNGDVINLSYEQEYFSNYNIGLSSRVQETNSPTDQISLSKVGTRGVRLSQVASSSAQIDFIEDTQARQDLMVHYLFGGSRLQDRSNANPTPMFAEFTARALKRIEISNNEGYCKAYELDYDYWYDDNTPLKGVLTEPDYSNHFNGPVETDKYRLVLRSFQELSCSGPVEIPPYIFSYYDEEMVPRRLSFALDHWGFYNGSDNEHLTPNISRDGGVNFINPNTGRQEADREARWPYMRAGSIKSIKYPTGGTTHYQFGHHELNSCEFQRGSQFNNLVMGFNQSEGWSDVMEHLPINKRIYFDIINISTGVGKVKINGTIYTESGFADVSNGQLSYQTYLDPESIIDNSGAGARFEFYESVFTNCDGPAQVVGGLRIEKVTQDDGVKSTPPLITTYEYENESGVSSGVLFSQPNYIAVVRNTNKIYSDGGSIPEPDFWTLEGCRAHNYQDPNTHYYTAEGPQSVHPLRSSQGSHFGYGYVKKNYLGGFEIGKFDTSGGISTGKVAITEVNNRVCSESYSEFPPRPEKHDFGRGNSLYSGIFNDQEVLLSERRFQKQYIIDQVGRIGGITSKKIDSNPDKSPLYTFYTIESGHLNQEVIEEISHFEEGNKGVRTTIDYSLNYPHLQHSIVTKDMSSNEELSRVTNTYASDFFTLEGTSCYQAFIQDSTAYANTFFTEIENCLQGYSSCDFPIINESRLDLCPYVNLLVFSHEINEARKRLKDCLATYEDERQNNYLAVTGSSRLEQVAALNEAHRGGTLIETKESKNGAFSKAFYLEFDDQLRVNKIYNQFGSEGVTFNDISSTDTDLVVDSNYELAQSIKYEGERIVEIQGRDGIVTSFLWKNTAGNDNDHPIAKVVGAPYDLVNSIYTANPDLDALSAHPDLSNAHVFTYVYEQAKGLIKATDPNGQVTEYEYDDLGRLSLIFNQEKVAKKIEYRYSN